jgi:hypothetical protein
MDQASLNLFSALMIVVQGIETIAAGVKRIGYSERAILQVIVLT